MPTWTPLAIAIVFLAALGWVTHRLLRRRAPALRWLVAIGVPLLLAAVAVAVGTYFGQRLGTQFATVESTLPKAAAPGGGSPPATSGAQPAEVAPKRRPPAMADGHAVANGSTVEKLQSEREVRTMMAPPAPTPDPAAFVRDQIKALVPGHVVFNPPATMREGRLERITVRITRGEAEGAIKSGLKGRGVPQVEKVQVGTFMRVRLYGDGFRVTPRSDENQAVPESGFAEWVFDVLPEASGTRELTLSVAVRFKLPGSEEVTDLPVLTRNITVEVDAWWRTREFFGANWQWFLGGIGSVLVGVAGFFGKRWLGLKEG